MNRRPLSWLVLALLLAPTLVAAMGAVALDARAAAATPVSGSITGPTIVSTESTTQYEISGFGGPAVSANGTVVGNLTFYASVLGNNLTGVTISPSTHAISSNQSDTVDLAVGNATESLSIDVMISSVYEGQNQSTNFSYALHVVQPYVVSATIVASSSWVLAFSVLVTLDGTVIGNVSVPALQPGGTYAVKFEYPTLGLSTGEHTFGISLAAEHGLVTFANGQTEYSQSVYVTGPSPNYTWWYVAGIVAFFGAIFIFATRVAARRRGASRR